MGLFFLLVLVVVVWAIAAFFFKTSGGTKSKEAGFYHSLLLKTMGDRETAERLIEGERKRHPTASRAQLIRYAIERLEQHNR